MGLDSRAEGAFLAEDAFILTAIMGFIMSMLNKATPDMMLKILYPLAIVVVVGVSGLLVGSVLIGKLLGYTGPMSMALSLTALYGFPPSYVLIRQRF